MNTSMIVYRLFDVADEINLDLVQALWTSRNKIASRLRLDRISTKSITFKAAKPIWLKSRPVFLIWELSA